MRNLGWNILGGEPPGGTDFELPVIEMKGSDLGSSLGSKKIDLICFKDNFFLLLELKKIFAVKPHHYSIILTAVTNTHLRVHVFTIDDLNFQLDEPSIDKMNQISSKSDTGLLCN